MPRLQFMRPLLPGASLVLVRVLVYTACFSLLFLPCFSMPARTHGNKPPTTRAQQPSQLLNHGQMVNQPAQPPQVPEQHHPQPHQAQHTLPQQHRPPQQQQHLAPQVHGQQHPPHQQNLPPHLQVQHPPPNVEHHPPEAKRRGKIDKPHDPEWFDTQRDDLTSTRRYWEHKLTKCTGQTIAGRVAPVPEVCLTSGKRGGSKGSGLRCNNRREIVSVGDSGFTARICKRFGCQCELTRKKHRRVPVQENALGLVI